MNNPFEQQGASETTEVSHINYGGGITIVCGAGCSCKNPEDGISSLKPSLWVRLLKRVRNPLHRSLASRLKD